MSPFWRGNQLKLVWTPKKKELEMNNSTLKGEIQKSLSKSTLAFRGQGGETQKSINFGDKLSFILSFLFFPERLAFRKPSILVIN